MKGADPRLIPGPGGLTGARLLAALLIGCIIGLLLGSRPLTAWAGKLPPGWERVQDTAASWDATMERAGLTAPYDTLHRTMRAWVGNT